MAQTVSVNFKLDAEVKKAMEKVCKEMGLSMSAAFTIFAKKATLNNFYYIIFYAIDNTVIIIYTTTPVF